MMREPSRLTMFRSLTFPPAASLISGMEGRIPAKVRLLSRCTKPLPQPLQGKVGQALGVDGMPGRRHGDAEALRQHRHLGQLSHRAPSPGVSIFP